MPLTRKTFLAAALGTFALGTALSQTTSLPEGPIRLVVPFAPGGGVDTTARLLAKQLQTQLNQPVIVENRAGASGTVGGKAVMAAAADGNTLLFSASTHVLARHVLGSPPYDPLTDFAPVARVAEAPLLMVIAPGLPQRSVKEVLDAARQQPDKWTAALPALGAASHIGTLMLASQGNLKLTTAAYRGTAPALTDVAGGHAQILVDSIIALLPMAKDGKVRAIATTSAKRATIAPDIPTAAESGYPKLVYSSWYGVWAPKGLPEARAQGLNKMINNAMNELEKSGALDKIGVEPVVESIEQFRRFMEADVRGSAELLKASGFKPE